jgi:hypothetical protein
MNLRNANETILLDLLDHDQDWADLIFDLEEFACFRGYLPGMEEHHIEPERDRTIYLWPLEHLSIHICHAKLSPSDSNHAKVGAFVKAFPGSFRRIINLREDLSKRVMSFGQTRPSKTVEEMTRIAGLPQARLAQRNTGSKTGAANGKKGAEKTRGKPRSVPVTWGDKISASIEAKGNHTCPHCGKVMKNIQSNILQHERGTKCRK